MHKYCVGFEPFNCPTISTDLQGNQCQAAPSIADGPTQTQISCMAHSSFSGWGNFIDITTASLRAPNARLSSAFINIKDNLLSV